MNIEISPKEYWKFMNPRDGRLYCSMVVIDGKDDWRYMKFFEKLKYLDNFEFIEQPFLALSIPVRDL